MSTPWQWDKAPVGYIEAPILLGVGLALLE